jgi:hypothetical protein
LQHPVREGRKWLDRQTHGYAGQPKIRDPHEYFRNSTPLTSGIGKAVEAIDAAARRTFTQNRFATSSSHRCCRIVTTP